MNDEFTSEPRFQKAGLFYVPELYIELKIMRFAVKEERMSKISYLEMTHPLIPSQERKVAFKPLFPFILLGRELQF